MGFEHGTSHLLDPEVQGSNPSEKQYFLKLKNRQFFPCVSW